MIFIPVSALLSWIFSILSYLVNFKFQGALACTTAHLVERTKDLNLVKTCNAQEIEIEKGKQFFKEQYDAQMKLGYATMLSSVIGSLLEIVGIAIPFLVGAAFVASGEMTIGALITFNGLFTNVRSSFNNMVGFVGNFSAANGAIARIRSFFDEEEEHPDAGTVLCAGEAKDIVFEQVVFAYREQDVIKNISCRIPKNKVTAVIGTNGSGKSTMFKLMARLYDPKSGTIRFGEEDSRSYSLHSWREQICLISQGAPMMAGTIRENMCFGRKDTVSDEELLEAAKLSHVWDFVKELPKGFDSEVAAGGSNFSGGQRQCVAIARAMLSKGQYLLLDESTSNLDVQREIDVVDALHMLMKNRTTIIIAHSIASIRKADYVLVLNNGKLESAGSPSQILELTDNYLKTITSRGAVRAEI